MRAAAVRRVARAAAGAAIAVVALGALGAVQASAQPVGAVDAEPPPSAPSAAHPDGDAAAPPPAEITADQAVALYRARSPRLAASRAAIDVTAADRIDAAIYPNPTLSLSTTNIAQGQDTFGHSQETVGLDVPILIGGQRGHRGRAADARVAAKRTAVDADQARAELEIRRRFIDLLAAQRKVVALATALDEARNVRAIVAGRQQAGAKSPYELERTDLALAALASRQDEAVIDAGAASGALAAAVGIPAWQPRAAGAFDPLSAATAPATAAPATAVPANPPTAAATANAAPANAAPANAALDDAHPALLAAAATAVAAREDESAAHADAIPTPSLQLQGFGTTDPQGIALTVGISIPLPFFDRNQGAVARAQAQQRAAELDRRATRDELAADLTRARAIEAARAAAATRFRADAIERLPRVRTMAEAAYRSGQGGIVELLDALDAITEAHLREIELVAAALDAELDVRAASRGR